MPIDVKETSSSYETKIELIGTIDEKAVLPLYPKASTLKIDFARITNINSIGVRNFIVWGEKHVDVKMIQLENCPAIFVKNFSGIFGFLKPNMKVISFFTPFYSEETHEAIDVHFLNGRDFNSEGLLRLPKVNDSKGNPMEMDVPVAYFSFLKK